MDTKRDLIFLFGAGASHGAGDVLPEVPPLGFQLYDELARIHPGSWGNLPAEIRQALRSSFEEGMQLIYEGMSPVIPELMRQMAIYFIQFRPASGRTLYCSLIDELRALGLLDRVLFSSLNYECVLEFSLLQKRILFNYFDEIPDNPNPPVWKLHGSCNMFATGIEATPGVIYSAGVTFEGGIRALMDSNEVIGKWLSTTALAPAMCLYMRGKPLNVSPGVIKRVQLMWREAVRNGTAIFCVGVNPYAEDGHIWDSIATTESNLHYIGGRASFETWAKKYRNGNAEFIAERFNIGFEALKTKLTEYATHG